MHQLLVPTTRLHIWLTSATPDINATFVSLRANSRQTFRVAVNIGESIVTNGAGFAFAFPILNGLEWVAPGVDVTRLPEVISLVRITISFRSSRAIVTVAGVSVTVQMTNVLTGIAATFAATDFRPGALLPVPGPPHAVVVGSAPLHPLAFLCALVLAFVGTFLDVSNNRIPITIDQSNGAAAIVATNNTYE